MVHGENRIPYWIDRRLTGLAGPEYHATISFGLPLEPEDSQYGKSRSTSLSPKCGAHVGERCLTATCKRTAQHATRTAMYL